MAISVRSQSWLSNTLAITLLASLSFAAQCGKTEEPKPDETPPPTPPAATLSTRQEINSFSADQIAALRKGVALMQAKENTNPTSWIYQANIHGVPDGGANCPASTDPVQPAWATCQHGSFYFLAWHRMYLYYFERILRSSIQEATGDPAYAFSLPYWDYANGSPQLPTPFTTPADSTNSLYVAQRRTICNTATPGQDCVTVQQGSADQALATIPACSCPNGAASCDGCLAGLNPDESFHGLFSATPVHFLGGFGELESQPHNTIHNRVGGPLGWMSDPDCAARDAIFWLHHANIDRLWQVWLNQNADRLNPIGSNAWTKTVFTFFDEKGTQVQMTGCQILNMATQLDYQYQDLPVENVVLCDESAAGKVAETTPPEAEAPPATVTMTSLGKSAVKATALSGSTVEMTLPVPATQRERVKSLAAQPAPEKLRLVIEGLKLEGKGGVFEVYLNLPKGAKPDPSGANFVGNLSVFGHVGHEASRSFDVTDELRDFLSGGGAMGDVKLTFVPVGNEDAKGKALLSFKSASLVTREK